MRDLPIPRSPWPSRRRWFVPMKCAQRPPLREVSTEIRGGQAQRLAKGDVMVIPAGVPHWFKEVPSSIDYYVVKVIAP